MTPKQKLELEQSEKRQKINEFLALAELSDEQRGELDTLTKRMQEIEPELRAAIVAEGEAEQRAADAFADEPDTETRERMELRSKASVAAYIAAALSGRQVAGAEAELRAAAGIGDGIPLELWDVPEPAEKRAEQRADAATGAPATGTGVNLDPIRPAVFSASIAPRLGIDMPRVMSGTFSTATISTSLTAGAKAKGADAESSAAAFTVGTTGPKRVSARLSIRAEDIASVGQANFESALRENLGMVLSDALDSQAISGDGVGANLAGLFSRLTDPTAPTNLATFDLFVESFAYGIDGLWASRMRDVAVVAGPETYRLAARTFRDAAGQDLGAESFADYAARLYGGFWTNKRMPDAASNVQQAILHRRGRMGLRTAVCPHWGEIGIDDIYSDSASATRHFTLHVLLGDVLIVQPAAYAQVAYKVA